MNTTELRSCHTKIFYVAAGIFLRARQKALPVRNGNLSDLARAIIEIFFLEWATFVMLNWIDGSRESAEIPNNGPRLFNIYQP